MLAEGRHKARVLGSELAKGSLIGRNSTVKNMSKFARVPTS